MSSLARRYGAIREIVGCCSTQGDTDATLRKILSIAEKVLSHASLEIHLTSDDGECRVVTLSDSRVSDACDIRKCAGDAPAGGWITTISNSVRTFGSVVSCQEQLTDEDREFLETVAHHLASLLSSQSNIRMDHGKRIEEISAIYEISQAFDNVSNDDLLNLITEKAALVMDAQACSLMLKNLQKDELVIKASYGLSEQVVGEAHVPFGEGIAGRVAQTGEPMLLTNLEEDPRFEHSGITPRPEIISSICVPLRDEEGHAQGVLSIHRKSPARVFTERDLELFSVFASQASLAISNARLYASLQERIQELSTLYDASRELSGAYSVEDASQALIRVAAGMTEDMAAMLILLDARQSGKVQAVSGIAPEVRKGVNEAINAATSDWLRQLRGALSLSLDRKRRWPVAMRPLVEAMRSTFGWVNLIPLMAEDSVQGVLILGDKSKRLPEQRRIRLLSIAASQAATIIKNASRYKAQMDQKVLELSALYRLSERISTAGSLKEALDSILDIIKDIILFDDAYISTVDYERRVMTVQACHRKAGDKLLGTEFSFEEDSLSSWSIQERKALLSPDISRDTRFRASSAQVRSRGVRSLMAIPLIVHDEVVGVLNIHAQAPNLYTEENVHILSVIASQAASLYKELEALSALANYTDNILRSIAAGVLTLDSEGQVLTWNKAAEDIIGVKASKAVGRYLNEILEQEGVCEADRLRTMDSIRMVLETGERFIGYKQEYRAEGRDPIYLNMSIAQLRDHSGEMLGLVIIAEGVTKEVQMENDMRRISELAAIGQLAASIAHEIRNPLSSIKGASQYLRNEYTDHTSLCEFLDIIIEEVNVLNKITTEFLDFARPTKLDLQETDVSDVVFRTIQFLQLDINKHQVEVTQNLSYDLPHIMADNRLLEQAFRNLVLNSLQAMPEGGTLTLSTEALGEGVRISVADSGVGIPEDQVSKIFVPFFTTKTKGTGLGLSIVQKIVENHGGRISVESEQGVGTKFSMTLPVCSDRARTAMIQAEDVARRGDIDFLRRV